MRARILKSGSLQYREGNGGPNISNQDIERIILLFNMQSLLTI